MRTYRALHADPTLLHGCGAIYDLPDGRTLWHYPPLHPDAPAELVEYRRQRIAQLDLRGHLVCTGDQHELAMMLSEASDD